MFRREAGDETFLSPAKPFSACGADIPKRALTINPPNETPPNGANREPVNVERHRHQRRSQEEYRRCACDIG
jgi:hypothetical protein